MVDTVVAPPNGNANGNANGNNDGNVLRFGSVQQCPGAPPEPEPEPALPDLVVKPKSAIQGKGVFLMLGAFLVVALFTGLWWCRRKQQQRRLAAKRDFDDAAIRKGPEFDSLEEKRRKAAERRRKLEAQKAKETEVEALFGDTREKPLSPKALRLKQLTEVTDKFEHLWPITGPGAKGYRAQNWKRAPTAEEIAAYAPSIGIDLDRHPHLLHLAEASLVAPLPHGYAQVCVHARLHFPPLVHIVCACK